MKFLSLIRDKQYVGADADGLLIVYLMAQTGDRIALVEGTPTGGMANRDLVARVAERPNHCLLSVLPDGGEGLSDNGQLKVADVGMHAEALLLGMRV